MANLEVKNPPEFTDKIYKTEREDLLTAELENSIKGSLLNNDVFLKQALLEESTRAKEAEETNENSLRRKAQSLHWEVTLLLFFFPVEFLVNR